MFKIFISAMASIILCVGHVNAKKTSAHGGYKKVSQRVLPKIESVEKFAYLNCVNKSINEPDKQKLNECTPLRGPFCKKDCTRENCDHNVAFANTCFVVCSHHPHIADQCLAAASANTMKASATTQSPAPAKAIDQKDAKKTAAATPIHAKD